MQKGAFGAVLMKTPQTVVDIIQEMVKAGVKIPITVKCRIGVDNLDSYEHLCDFIRLISTSTPVTHFIVHARKCWLKGLSPKQNRSVPPLKHEVVYQVTALIFTGRGFFTQKHGSIIYFVRRKVRHD